jgi:outer membrane protein TolC
MTKLFLLLLILSATSVAAQIRFENLDQCLAFLKQNNPALQSENLYVEINEEKLRSAYAMMLPQLKTFGAFDNNISLPVQLVPAQFLGANEGDFAEVQFGTRYNTSFGAEASLSLINVANWKNIKSAKLAIEATQYQQQDHELNVAEQATTAYYMALLSRQAVLLNKELVSASDTLLKSAAVRLNNGIIEQLEFNRIKSLYLESVQQYYDNQGTFEKNLNILKSLAGLSKTDSLILNETIQQTLGQNPPVSLSISFSSLPGYKMLAYKRLQSLEELKRQRSKALPEILASARYTRHSFSNELSTFSSDQPWYEIGVVGFRAEWTLFTGLNRHSTIRQSSLRAQIATNELRNYTLQSSEELEALRINYNVARQAIHQYETHYKLNSESYLIAGKKYGEGVYSVDQYITIYQELVRSQNLYLGKLANYLIYASIINTKNAFAKP